MGDDYNKDVELAVRPDPPSVPGDGYPDKNVARRPSAAAMSAAAAGYSRRGGDDLTVAVWSLGGPLGLTFFASIIQSAAAIAECASSPIATGNCSGVFGFAVALGIISSVLIAVYLVMFTFARSRLPEKSMMYLSAFLFLWWCAGVGATTFNVVDFAGTKYFATWAALIFSGLIMHSEWEQFRHAVATMQHMGASSRPVFYLFLASIVELISAAFACGSPSVFNPLGEPQCAGADIYALVVGIVSIVLCLALLKVDSDRFRGADKPVALFLALWWAVAMGFLTIAPTQFRLPNNGFFSTWIAFFASFFVAQSKIFPMSAAAASAQ